MTEDQVKANLKAMDDVDFDGWNNADWHGVFAHQHTDDVFVDFKGHEPTRGLEDHIDAMKAFVESVGGHPAQGRFSPDRVRGRRVDLRRRRVRGREPDGDRCEVARRRYR
jgi:hypothetical protein